MKISWKNDKPGLVKAAACAVFLLIEVLCELGLPLLLCSLANVGFRQNGMDPGAPKAFSAQGMALLQVFMNDQDRELMDEVYLELRPGSSEARRYGEKYPIALERRTRVLRDDLDETTIKKADNCYNKASCAMYLYLSQAETTGELEGIAQRYSLSLGKNPGGGEFKGNIRVPSREEGPSSEGVLGSVPEGAMFDFPQESSAVESGAEIGSSDMITAFEDSSEPDRSEGSQGEKTSAAEAEQAVKFRFSGWAEADLEQMYTLLPLLDHASESRLKAARDSAAEMPGKENHGIALKKLFYREAGINVEEFRDSYALEKCLAMLGLTCLGLLCAGLAGFVILKDRPNDSRIFPGLWSVIYAPVLAVGCVILALQKSPSLLWLVILGVVFAAASIFALSLPRFSGLREFAGKWNPVSWMMRRPMAVWHIAFLVPSITVLMNLICLVILWAAGGAIAASPLQTGDIMAFLQYAVQGVLAFLLAAALPAALAGKKQNSEENAI